MNPATVAAPAAAPADHGAELKRGALTNTIALLASNFRGVFTFLVARILGPAALGTFLVAWNAVEVLSKLSLFGLENTTIAFVARAEAAGDRGRSRSLFRLVVVLALAQSVFVAAVSLFALQLLGGRFGLDPRVTDSLTIMLCALPGISLYAINTAVSRGMKVMRHDIFSRGLTESTVTSVAFLIALSVGARTFGPAYAVVAGTAASGLVALFLARSLFRVAPQPSAEFSDRVEARRLLSYSAHISIYELLNAIIVRMDVIMLAFFIGRAPGVTLPVVGIYGAVVEVAGGLRKVNQSFNPIFAPVIAGLTADGEQERAASAFSRVAQWMLWVLLPLLAVMIFAGGTILTIYGPEFRTGSTWLIIVAVACGTNAFVGLAETVIMVQKPRVNVLNSAITCAVAFVANIFLIRNFGVTGAAFGILLPYALLGLLRHRALRSVFQWRNPWANISPPFIGALFAIVPAIVCRLLVRGIAGEISSALVFLIAYFVAWRYHRARQQSVLACPPNE
ncbi:MAG TPA: oligosaccharide flippase family protein [Chthoniobacterales bacterium]|nr:oligosaccharide flippase family protein [Chthoniobacterales bacterium]